MNCKNCESPTSGNFCADCGQSTTVNRYNIGYLSHKLLDSFELEKGVFPGFLFLLYKPGIAIRDYINGKRIGFYSPLKLFLITGAVASFITFEYGVFVNEEQLVPDFIPLADMSGYSLYSGKYFSFFSLTAIPVFTFFSWLIFKKSQYNYIENLVMNIYVAAGQFLIFCLFAPILIHYPDGITMLIYGVLNFVYNIWVLMVFFKAFDPVGIFKSIATAVVPGVVIFFINYLVYRIAPKQFWYFLDLTFS